MRTWLTLFVVLLSTHAALAQSPSAVVEETLYHDFQQKIKQGDSLKQAGNGLSSFEQSLFVDALWDLVEEDFAPARKALANIQTFHYDLEQRLRLALLKFRFLGQQLPQDLQDEVYNALLLPEVDVKLIYLLASYQDMLLPSSADLYELAWRHPNFQDVLSENKARLSDEVVADLFYNSPDVSSIMNGRYSGGVKIFMFCRTKRLFPCLMVMRDINGKVVRNKQGEIWTNPALASSARALPSHQRNGNTPAGIFSIDSVMPTADQQRSFGKFRRMILNFIPKSSDERFIKSLLPPSSHEHEWWKATIVARDIGRNLFRIHGTGKMNEHPYSAYYPFMRTSGCIAQRENTYHGVTYRDQQVLLYDVLKAMRIAPNYANESKVKGLIYLMEIDDKAAPVTADDLRIRGIE